MARSTCIEHAMPRSCCSSSVKLVRAGAYLIRYQMLEHSRPSGQRESSAPGSPGQPMAGLDANLQADFSERAVQSLGQGGAEKPAYVRRQEQMC